MQYQKNTVSHVLVEPGTNLYINAHDTSVRHGQKYIRHLVVRSRESACVALRVPEKYMSCKKLAGNLHEMRRETEVNEDTQVD